MTAGRMDQNTSSADAAASSSCSSSVDNAEGAVLIVDGQPTVTGSAKDYQVVPVQRWMRFVVLLETIDAQIATVDNQPGPVSILELSFASSAAVCTGVLVFKFPRFAP